jgi:hypothetical protein
MLAVLHSEIGHGKNCLWSFRSEFLILDTTKETTNQMPGEDFMKNMVAMFVNVVKYKRKHKEHETNV